MKILNKIQPIWLILFTLLIFTNLTFAQNVNKNCFEIKYLDFFGLDKIGEIKWSDEDIVELLKWDYEEKFNDTRFFIPILVSQLKDFHPACNKSVDTERFNKLVSLYAKTALLDASRFENKSIEEKLNFIRDDFYQLVQIEDLLPKMQFTFDDGPLYGEIPKNIPKIKPLESVFAEFGKLSIVESNKKVFLVATDKNNKTIWSRIMKGIDPKHYLGGLRFNKNPVEKTSLAYIIHLSTGERLTLYIKLNGQFMYYYHSW